MEPKNINSRAYHAEKKKAENEGCNDFEAKRRAREAGKKAVADWKRAQNAS